MEKVLVVEEVFSIGKRGVMVLPSLPLSSFKGKVLPIQVELRFSSGQTITKAAHFGIPRVSPPPKEHSLVCQIKNVTKEECPIGTEVWATINHES
jgi:hypothetical protein